MASGSAVLKWLAIFVLLAGAYALFVGSFSVSEALAAVPAVAAGFGFAVLMSRNAERPLRLRGKFWRVVLTLPGAVAVDSWRVGLGLARSLVRPVSGIVKTQAFAPGGGEADDAGRRAVVILATSLAPNGYVMRVKPDALAVHQLAPAKLGDAVLKL